MRLQNTFASRTNPHLKFRNYLCFRPYTKHFFFFFFRPSLSEHECLFRGQRITELAMNFFHFQMRMFLHTLDATEFYHTPSPTLQSRDSNSLGIFSFHRHNQANDPSSVVTIKKFMGLAISQTTSRRQNLFGVTRKTSSIDAL